jgi:hypothetical protein
LISALLFRFCLTGPISHPIEATGGAKTEGERQGTDEAPYAIKRKIAETTTTIQISSSKAQHVSAKAKFTARCQQQ